MLTICDTHVLLFWADQPERLTHTAREALDQGQQEETLARGRIQAQGAGYEDSETWSQPNPLSSTDGIAMLDRLVARMPQRVYQPRRTAVQKTRTWILRVAQAGGADAPISKTFLEPGSRDERIDIEIIAGSAFVP